MALREKTACLVLGLVLSSVGCRTRPLDGVSALDGSFAAADLGSPVADVDFGVAMCTHDRELVTLRAISSIDASEQVGRAVRVRAEVPLRDGCDFLAELATAVQVGNATDLVTLTARVWRKRGGPCGAERVVPRVVVISDAGPLSNSRVVVHDGAPGGTASLTLMLAPSTGTCDAFLPPGLCQLDCQCTKIKAADRCYPWSTGSPDCLESCSEDADCSFATQRCSGPMGEMGEPNFTCFSSTFPSPCTTCPFGQSCQSGSCRPQPAAPERTCGCDSDCAATQLCAATLVDGEEPHAPICITPCTTDHDCPPGLEACLQGRCRPLE